MLFYEAGILWLVFFILGIIHTKIIHKDRRATKLRYSYDARALHLQMARAVVDAHISGLDEQRRTLAKSRPAHAFIIVLDIRTAIHAQMDIALMSTVDYLKNRGPGDCPKLEERAGEMLTQYLTKQDPKERLVEMRIAWNLERGIAMMIGLRKDGAEWEITGSLVRVEYARQFAPLTRTHHIQEGRRLPSGLHTRLIAPFLS
jgi:hypothetical protein